MDQVVVGVPAYGDFKAQTVQALINAINSCPVPVRFEMVRRTYLPAARQELAERAIKAGASHLLMVDTDMMFPPDVIARLAAHDKDIVAVNAHLKALTPDGQRISMVKFGAGPGEYESRPLDTTKAFECAAVGTPVILINLKSLQRVPKPWFDLTYDGAGALVGEDIFFCAKAREHGLEVWCDPTIDVKHIGEALY